MRRFKLHSGSSLGASDREEVDGHMLCEQDPCRSSDELHDKERAFGSGLRIREVLTVHLGEQDHHLHRSCDTQILSLQEGGKATTHTMGVASSRNRLRDQRQEGHKKLNGRSFIASPHSSAGDISDTFLEEHLLAISSHAPWFALIINFIMTGSIS